MSLIGKWKHRRIRRLARTVPSLVFVNGRPRIDGKDVPLDEPVSFWMGSTLFKDCVFTADPQSPDDRRSSDP